MNITAYLVSLGVGLAVGVVYGLLQVRSPAPPIIALVGLLGMLGGEAMVTHFRRTPGQDALIGRGDPAARPPGPPRE